MNRTHIIIDEVPGRHELDKQEKKGDIWSQVFDDPCSKRARRPEEQVKHLHPELEEVACVGGCHWYSPQDNLIRQLSVWEECEADDQWSYWRKELSSIDPNEYDEVSIVRPDCRLLYISTLFNAAIAKFFPVYLSQDCWMIHDHSADLIHLSKVFFKFKII